ncbi:hypothetical protein [Streptomyces sp. NPDC088789]|uniref:hypothetical protein n=1 Tax=Streptomyces sp. NPDC088789 TaxID=3365899 RepID=UPI0037F27A1E
MDTITMRTLAAGPDGTYEAGRTYTVGRHIPAEQADAFVRGGYAVPGDRETATAADPGTAEADEIPTERWKLDQLRQYAAGHGIELGDATKKAEILDRILAELARREAEADERETGTQGGGA